MHIIAYQRISALAFTCNTQGPLSFLRLECVRGSPERAGVKAVGVKREDLAVELLCSVRGLGDAVEVAEVLAGLCDDLRVVVAIWASSGTCRFMTRSQ